VLIGAMLAAEGFDIHIDKAVLYGAMGFAIAVEVLNLVYKSRKDKRRAKSVEPVHLRPARLKEDGTHEETPVR
jgi:predicted tellurium resistance membrane protein TerC